MPKISNKNSAMYIMGFIFSIIGIAELIAAIFIFIFLHFNDSWIVVMVLGIQGLVFTPIGLCFFLPEYKRRRRRKYLMEYGEKYQGEVVDIYYKTSVQVNGQCPLIVECTYVDWHGEKFLVKSGPVWLRGYADKEDFYGDVYVNPDAPEDYHVEVGVNEKDLENVRDLR